MNTNLLSKLERYGNYAGGKRRRRKSTRKTKKNNKRTRKIKKTKFKKGGASTFQIGLANEMRTFATPGYPTYYALSDISHSADDPYDKHTKDYSLLFRNLNTKDGDKKVTTYLDILYPSYLRKKYLVVSKMRDEGKLHPLKADYILNDILNKDPRANNNHPGYNDDWGMSSTFVQRLYGELAAKRRKSKAEAEAEAETETNKKRKTEIVTDQESETESEQIEVSEGKGSNPG